MQVLTACYNCRCTCLTPLPIGLMVLFSWSETTTCAPESVGKEQQRYWTLMTCGYAMDLAWLGQAASSAKVLHNDRVVWWYSKLILPEASRQADVRFVTQHHELSVQSSQLISSHIIAYHLIQYDIINHRNLRNAPCFVAVVLGAFCCCSLALWCCGAYRTSWLCLAMGTEGSGDGPSVTQRFQRFRL